MKLKRFDVVKLNNDKKATILDLTDKNTYFVEIVDDNGITLDKKYINEIEIKEVIFTK